MLRLRNSKGKTIALNPDVKSVEICDEQGRIAAVVQQVEPDRVRVVSGADDEFLRYVAAFGLKTTQVMEEEDR